MITEKSVDLRQMLDAREKRMLRQRELISKYNAAVICFTMNIAGPVKNGALIQRGFLYGQRELIRHLSAIGAKRLHFESSSRDTGCEAFHVIDMPPARLKRIAVGIEDNSEIGRLFDIDVHAPDMSQINREALGFKPRACLICEKPAHECARSRAHSIELLQEKTRAILKSALDSHDAQTVAQQACRALLYEVCTTPKPGLVDCMNNGSHEDMDIFTFMSSASALWPYFEKCALTGMRTASQPAGDTFEALRWEGERAEGIMFDATNGVNTHKGAIFSLGIVCAAVGRLEREDWSHPEIILRECANMTRGITNRDFEGVNVDNARTIGEKLYAEYGITGVRGQVEAGFPTVLEKGLPTLEGGLSRGLSVNESGCAALLAIMSEATDTNLISRGGIDVQRAVASETCALLAKNPYPDVKMLIMMDEAFREKRLSPGGSADLLSICYFLHFIRECAADYVINRA
ncbi:MAG: triphosphoribosyl-dephospho-CoA synthase CitG [Clostridia bacterium]|nr:triphosphoribosyl-dephospho-CoA synthase CitG [Clostridia bacterium]